MVATTLQTVLRSRIWDRAKRKGKAKGVARKFSAGPAQSCTRSFIENSNVRFLDSCTKAFDLNLVITPPQKFILSCYLTLKSMLFYHDLFTHNTVVRTWHKYNIVTNKTLKKNKHENVIYILNYRRLV